MPPPEFRDLRDLTRLHKVLVRERGRQINRVAKTLELANVKLGFVVSDIMRMTGRAILEAKISGEEDPHAVADLARGSIRRKRKQLAEVVPGLIRPHSDDSDHRFRQNDQPLWLEYRAVHPNGYQYSWYCEHYRAWREQLDVVMRQVYRAGEKAFVDYAGLKFPVVDRGTSEVRDAMVFVGFLGASNYTSVDVTRSRSLPDWTMSHVPMFTSSAGSRHRCATRRSSRSANSARPSRRSWPR